MDFIGYSLIKDRFFFLPEDIETLRQKILEDIEDDYEVNETDFGEQQIVDIINKRFGVKL